MKEGAQTKIRTTRTTIDRFNQWKKLAAITYFKALKNHITLEYLLNARNLKREDLSPLMRLPRRTLTSS